MRDDTAYPARTSVPIWDPAPPTLPPTATAWTLFSLGSADGATVGTWVRELTAAGVDHEVVTVEEDRLADWLGDCVANVQHLAATRHVGWRIAATGEEVGVLAVQAAARHLGLLDEELTLHAESRTRRLLYCPHCTSTTLTSQSQVVCAGCHQLLTMRPHVSRERGAYLGVAEPAR
jgi:dimethylamine monooxygenase subunit C